MITFSSGKFHGMSIDMIQNINFVHSVFLIQITLIIVFLMKFHSIFSFLRSCNLLNEFATIATYLFRIGRSIQLDLKHLITLFKMGSFCRLYLLFKISILPIPCFYSNFIDRFLPDKIPFSTHISG